MTTTLITGANKGLGFEAARQLVAAGHTVYIGARNSDRGRRAAEQLGARFLQLDVTDDSSVAAVAKAIEADGGLDVLVNNAGIEPRTGDGGFVPAAEVTADLVRGVFETNVFGQVRMLHGFLPLLQRSAAPVVVNVSSGTSLIRDLVNPDSPAHFYPTKALLLRAATTEFAEHGLAGARIDRIAERADANKRLLYVYFGDKNQLFDAVVQEQIKAMDEAAPLPDGDLVAFAAARYDHIVVNPEARRIAAWRSFEQPEPPAGEVKSFKDRIDAVDAAQRSGRLRADIPAVDLFALVLRLTESWLTAPPALKAAGGESPMADERLTEHRAAMLEAVRGIAEPPAAL